MHLIYCRDTGPPVRSLPLPLPLSVSHKFLPALCPSVFVWSILAYDLHTRGIYIGHLRPPLRALNNAHTNTCSMHKCTHTHPHICNVNQRHCAQASQGAQMCPRIYTHLHLWPPFTHRFVSRCLRCTRVESVGIARNCYKIILREMRLLRAERAHAEHRALRAPGHYERMRVIQCVAFAGRHCTI